MRRGQGETIALVLIGALGLLFGCATSKPEMAWVRTAAARCCKNVAGGLAKGNAGHSHSEAPGPVAARMARHHHRPRRVAGKSEDVITAGNSVENKSCSHRVRTTCGPGQRPFLCSKRDTADLRVCVCGNRKAIVASVFQYRADGFLSIGERFVRCHLR